MVLRIIRVKGGLRQQPGAYNPPKGTNNTEAIIFTSVTEDYNKFRETFNKDATFAIIRIGQYAACPTGMYKVALVMAEHGDYHWVRQDKDGFWSHKNGDDPASEVDDANNLIYNLKYAYWENYYFVAFYAVCPWNNEFKSSPPDYCFTNWGQAEYCDEYNAFLANISRSRNLSLRE